MSIVSVLAMALSSSAYQDGTYKCRNSQGLPDNRIKIETVSVTGETKLPLVESTRYYRLGDAPAPVKSATMKGFAVVSSTNDSDLLLLAALRLEFVDGRLLGCEKQ